MASTLVTLAYVSVFLVFIFLVYRRSLPRPIPGDIPYNKEAAARPFGAHIPSIIRAPEPLQFFLQQCHDRKSPIFQLFLEPFGKPSVVIADARESHDILARRTKEFDRSRFFADLFVALAPNNQVVMPTNDQWHSNRKLMADTMSPSFLAQSAAPQAQAVWSTFIELWRARARLAKGRPFEAAEDIDCAMLDAITAVAFGSSSHATESERDYVLSSGADEREEIYCDQTTAKFTRQPAPAEHIAVEALAHSASISGDSPLGSLHHRFALAFYPKLRAATKVRRNIVTRQINKAVEKFSNPEAAGDEVRSAADLIISREIAMAKKDNRKAQFDAPVIDDELFGFVVAGYDTTATTIKWGVKLLSKHQEVQKKLRSELRAAFPDVADQERALPSAEDIGKRRPAYLDAVIEEILRIGNPGVSPMRTTTQDVTILGHAVPKGTDVIMLSIGPSQTEPPLYVDESKRSKTSQSSIDSAYTGSWDPETLGEFMPERWLQQNEKGKLEFNPRAGAQQTFGGGLRGCFGRRLAYVVLRIVFAYIVWDFELQSLGDELGTLENRVVLTSKPLRCHVKLRNLRAT